MGWVTLDDGQHVFIQNGRVLADRSSISKVSGASDRGKALAGRSKAALVRAARGKSQAAPPKKAQRSPEITAKRAALAKVLKDRYRGAERQRTADPKYTRESPGLAGPLPKGS